MKSLFDSLSKFIQAFFDVLSKRRVIKTPQPLTKTTTPEPIPPFETDVTIPSDPLPKIEEPVLPPQSKGFLVCPIQANDKLGNPVTSRTVKISAVVDHSGTAIDPDSNKPWGKQAKDQKVKAFNGEIGFGKQCPVEPCGYQKGDASEFFANKEINYVGVLSDGGKCTLQYDGHAGYDYPYATGTTVLAPASGELFKAKQGVDLIYFAQWSKDHSFYIKHENGSVTWFRHCSKLADDIETVIGTDFSKSCPVKLGQVIALSGDFEFSKVKGTPAHLHFEVRNVEGKIIDPYADNLWQDYVQTALY